MAAGSAASITNRDDTIRRINANLRQRRDWNTDIDSSIHDPRDVLYNELIDAACALLDVSSPPAPEQ
jgi:hypothetical protein